MGIPFTKNSGIATVIPVEFHWNISDTLLEYQWYTTEIPVEIPMVFQYYEGDPRSNTNTSVISSTFGISNQRTNGPVNAHLISWPSKAQNKQNLENIW